MRVKNWTIFILVISISITKSANFISLKIYQLYSTYMYMYVSTQVIDRHVHRYIDRHTDSQRDRQTNRETDTYKQTERAIDRQRYRERAQRGVEGRGGRGGRGGLLTSRTVALSGETRILNLEVCTARMDKR